MGRWWSENSARRCTGTGSADRVVTGPWARALIVAPTPLRALGPHPERPFRQGFGVAVDADTRQGNKPAHG
jgi:hypothetical protein